MNAWILKPSGVAHGILSPQTLFQRRLPVTGNLSDSSALVNWSVAAKSGKIKQSVHCLIQGKTLLAREPILQCLNRDRANRGECVVRGARIDRSYRRPARRGRDSSFRSSIGCSQKHLLHRVNED